MPSGNGKLSFERDMNATVIMLAERVYQRVYAN
jgi:hypothetical protein